jgi:hypothetical protein
VRHIVIIIDNYRRNKLVRTVVKFLIIFGNGNSVMNANNLFLVKKLKEFVYTVD